MSFQSFSELKDLDDVKLSEEIVDAKKSLFDMRLKKAKSKNNKPQLYKNKNSKIAQLITIEQKKKKNKN